MKLLLLHPTVAFRDCVHCQEFQYNETTGDVEQWRGMDLKRIGKPPCRTSVGCPKGTPEDKTDLSDANWQAYQHYKRCKAVGRFPDDPIVARNAEVIGSVESHIASIREIQAVRRNGIR